MEDTTVIEKALPMKQMTSSQRTNVQLQVL